MDEKSIRCRLQKLEAKRRFLDWFVRQRFYHTLTEQELMTFALDGQLPVSIPNRPSTLDRLDRKTLHRLWKDNERILRVEALRMSSFSALFFSPTLAAD